MNFTELKFSIVALREGYFIAHKPIEVIEKWIAENGYNVSEISEFLNSMTVEKRAQFHGIDHKTALENMNREIVAFNIYFPGKMVGKIHHKIAAYRLTAGKTQKELAEKIKIRPATFCEFEKGKHAIGSDILSAIMKELELSICKIN